MEHKEKFRLLLADHDELLDDINENGKDISKLAELLLIYKAFVEIARQAVSD